MLKNLEKETRTTVFYEAPHRLTDTLKALLDAAGDREAATVREITKKFEEVRRDSLSGLLKYYGETRRGASLSSLSADSAKACFGRRK